MSFYRLLLFLGLCLVSVYSVVSVATAATPECSLLTRNLSLGSTGNDVKALQMMLNSNAQTRIAAEGPGSPGNETTYFGTKTKTALIAFQELYPTEVLNPVGLTRGSGFFGSLSRGKITALCVSAGKSTIGKGTTSSVNATTKPTTPVTSTTASSGTTNPPVLVKPTSEAALVPTRTLSGSALSLNSNLNDPYIMSLQSNIVVAGEKLVILGGGFAHTGNSVTVGSTVYRNIAPSAFGLEVTIPSTAARGRFDVSFSNGTKESNKTFVVITNANASAPDVTSFLPLNGIVGTKVTVYGENFTKTGNVIIFGGATIPATLSADGKSLTFVVQNPIIDPEDEGSLNVTDTIGFFVTNANGISNVSLFKLHF